MFNAYTGDISNNVLRIVITSSIGAVVKPGSPAGTTYTDEDWNDIAVKTVEEQGSESPGIYKYWASKVIAERGKTPIC